MKNQGLLANHNGNVFVIILIMIVLLGALTLTITRMSGTTTEVSQEQSRVVAAQIARYMSSIKTGVEQLTANGISENEICFDAPDFKFLGTQSLYYSACDNPATKVFGPRGAGIKDINSTSFAPNTTWEVWGGLSVIDVGTSAPDLVMQLNNISLTLCTELNRLAGISPPQPVVDNASGPPKFAGRFEQNSGSVLGDEWTVLSGRNSGCRISSGKYFYYQVLIPR